MSTNAVDALPSQQSRREYDDKSNVSTPRTEIMFDWIKTNPKALYIARPDQASQTSWSGPIRPLNPAWGKTNRQE